MAHTSVAVELFVEVIAGHVAANATDVIIASLNRSSSKLLQVLSLDDERFDVVKRTAVALGGVRISLETEDETAHSVRGSHRKFTVSDIGVEISSNGLDHKVLTLISHSSKASCVTVDQISHGASAENPRVTKLASFVTIILITRVTAKHSAAKLGAVVVPGVDGETGGGGLEKRFKSSSSRENAVIPVAECAFGRLTTVESTKDHGKVKAIELVEATLPVQSHHDVVSLGVPERVKVVCNSRLLAVIVACGLVITKGIGETRAEKEGTALDNASEEVITVNLFPDIEGRVHPVVSNVLKIILDTAALIELDVVVVEENEAGLTSFDEVKGVLDHHDRAQSRTVVLRASPGLVIDATIHVELGLYKCSGREVSIRERTTGRGKGVIK